MQLSREGIRRNREEYLRKGYVLPSFDYESVLQNTRRSPLWIHFGPGNLFKAFPAHAAQRLLDAGALRAGLIAAEGYDYEIIEKSARPYDNLTILVTLNPDETVEKTVIGSILESLVLNRADKADFDRLEEIFASPSLQLASFTITEKGYATVSADGVILPSIAADFAAGPGSASSYLGKVAALLYRRWQSGQLPLAMVSMDNCSHNGDLLQAAMSAFAGHWCEAGLAEAGFADYVANRALVTFPLTMIDKITPRPDPAVEKILAADGLEALSPIVTSFNSYAAPYVNAEKCEYLVIEDAFPNGRPPLEQAGILFTDRETVEKAEKMKVGTCLNPLHTALAVFGCLLGCTSIAEEMKDPALRRLTEQLARREGLPVAADPGILDPVEYLDTVLRVRFPNPFLPDSPQRIATDTSLKLAVRFGETIRAYRDRPDLDVNDLTLIPLVIAGWFRYLMGVDDRGRAFPLSPDPALPSLTPLLADFSLGQPVADFGPLRELLSNEKLFGLDLVSVGLAPKIERLFGELAAGEGAVRAALEKYTA
ncbi:MAG: mannitol dehydrogenase family protein [Muribaculum sp.]|nr:mannitol dehydrogenase family protein [Muribaculum sp.]